MAQRYFTVTWDQLHRDSKALAWRLLHGGPWKGIVAITSGGLIPAAIVARELECWVIETIPVVTYDEKSRSEPDVMKQATAGCSEHTQPAPIIAWQSGKTHAHRAADWCAKAGIRR
jgi:hypoxanthine phosphoribosyltransferase